MKTFIHTLLAATVTVVALTVAPATAAPVARPGASHTDGAACTVVAGPNAGKSGTFDGGFCEGSWGATECVDQQGRDNGKCKAAKKSVVSSSVVVPRAKVQGALVQ